MADKKTVRWVPTKDENGGWSVLKRSLCYVDLVYASTREEARRTARKLNRAHRRTRPLAQ